MNRRAFLNLGLAAAVGAGSGYLSGHYASGGMQDVLERAVRATATLNVFSLETRRMEGGESPSDLVGRNYGSAAFIDRSGLALTNSHVVRDASQIQLLDSDGNVWDAEVLAEDPLVDLALVRIEGPVPHILEMRQAGVGRGERIGAIGSPYEYAASLSEGVVSGVARGRRKSGPGIFFQHTAMINPGSSGGPVLDANGRLVGINTAIPDGQFEFAGISLALGCDLIRLWVARFRQRGGFYRAKYGMALRISEYGQLSAPPGPFVETVLVESIGSGGPAERAGLRAGDQVVSFNTRRVLSQSSLLADMLMADPDMPQRIVVLRSGQENACLLHPEAYQLRRNTPAEPSRALGITVSPSAPPTIADIAPRSPAAYAGLEAGDRIHAIGTDFVHSPDEAIRLLRRYSLVAPIAVSRGNGDTRWINVGAVDPGGMIAGNNRGTSTFDI